MTGHVCKGHFNVVTGVIKLSLDFEYTAIIVANQIKRNTNISLQWDIECLHTLRWIQVSLVSLNSFDSDKERDIFHVKSQYSFDLCVYA